MSSFDEGWISGRGPQIEEFESDFATYVGRRHAISVANGTVALHLAFWALGLKPGDDVVLPTYTYVACANSVRHFWAHPRFCDSNPSTLQIDVESALDSITQQTKIVLLPHLYGYAESYRELAEELDKRGIHFVEDCAEMLGARDTNGPLGRDGIISTYSFFANKTITTGEGGMLVTDDDALAGILRRLRNQGQVEAFKYDFDIVGFNYRMTNLQAALGIAQLRKIDQFVATKRSLFDRYRQELDDLGVTFLGDSQVAESSQWLVTMLLPENVNRTAFIESCRKAGVDVRPGFIPMHLLPMYNDAVGTFPKVEQFHQRVVCLPSFPELTREEQDTVIGVVKSTLGRPIP